MFTCKAYLLIILIIISYFFPESDISPKHASQSQSSSSSSDAQITVQTPNASKFFDDIFAVSSPSLMSFYFIIDL